MLLEHLRSDRQWLYSVLGARVEQRVRSLVLQLLWLGKCLQRKIIWWQKKNEFMSIPLNQPKTQSHSTLTEFSWPLWNGWITAMYEYIPRCILLLLLLLLIIIIIIITGSSKTTNNMLLSSWWLRQHWKTNTRQTICQTWIWRTTTKFKQFSPITRTCLAIGGRSSDLQWHSINALRMLIVAHLM